MEKESSLLYWWCTIIRSFGLFTWNMMMMMIWWSNGMNCSNGGGGNKPGGFHQRGNSQDPGLCNWQVFASGGHFFIIITILYFLSTFTYWIIILDWITHIFNGCLRGLWSECPSWYLHYLINRRRWRWGLEEGARDRNKSNRWQMATNSAPFVVVRSMMSWWNCLPAYLPHLPVVVAVFDRW